VFCKCVIGSSTEIRCCRSQSKAAAYAAGHDDVLRNLQASVGPSDFIIANNYALKSVAATMLESFDASDASIQQLQALAQQVSSKAIMPACLGSPNP
jgi:hypothetical protein